MRDDYAQIVSDVCTDRWSYSDTPADERDGGFGVAMTLAYLNGTRPNLTDFASALRVPSYALEMAFKRLQMNGVFAPDSPILNDDTLKGVSNRRSRNDRMAYHRAWCHIAGLASGYCGKGLTREEMAVGAKHERARNSRY